MNGIWTLTKSWESSLLLFTLSHVRVQEVISLQPERETLPELNYADTLISNFQLPELQEINMFFKPPSLWYSVTAAWTRIATTPRAEREPHPRSCSFFTCHLPPAQGWGLALLGENMATTHWMAEKLHWCCARGTWSSLWHLLETCLLGCPRKPPIGKWHCSEFAVNQTERTPGETACCWVPLAAWNCRARSYRSYRVRGAHQNQKEKAASPPAPLLAKRSTGKAYH